MINYYETLVWNINKALLCLSVALSGVLVAYVVIISYFENRRRRNLLAIKKNVHALAAAEQKPTGEICLAVEAKTSQAFLDVEMGREGVLFEETEKQFIKKCFSFPEKMGLVRSLAKGSRNKWRRIEGLLSLGYSEDPGALEIIKEAVNDKDEDIAYFALLALSLIKDIGSAKILLGLLRDHPAQARKIMSILEKFPPFVADEAIKLTDDSDPAIRAWALKLISKLGPERYFSKIVEFASDPSTDVRVAVCDCLKVIGREEARNVLLRCLKDTEWPVRIHAVRALTAISGGEAMREIAALMNDGSLAVREAVKYAMAGHIKESLGFIEKIFVDGDEMAKKEAIEALDISGYTATILKGLVSEDNSERDASTRLVEKMLKASAHFGIETALYNFNRPSQKKILEVIKSIDAPFAWHLEKRSKNVTEEI